MEAAPTVTGLEAFGFYVIGVASGFFIAAVMAHIRSRVAIDALKTWEDGDRTFAIIEIRDSMS